jgi:N-methylhydantoinase A
VVAGGGSGPSHAWALCRELGLDGFVVPATATAQSAFGAGTSDLRTTASRTCYVRLPGGVEPDDSHAALVTEAMRDTARRALSAIPASKETEVSYSASVRYHGQAHHLDVRLDSGPDASALSQLLKRFEADYEMLFGKGAGYREAGFEILSARAVAVRRSAVQTASTSSQSFETRGSRPVVFNDPNAPEDTIVYGCDWPRADQVAAGPCLIQLPGCVVVVPPGSTAVTDSLGAIHVKADQP